MRDENPKTIRELNFNIIVNLHPTNGTHWVLVIRREGGPVYYFDSFGVETPTLSLEEYVDLGSNERIQQYDESYCGAYCLYMIYLIDRGFRIKSTLNILVNQVKCPEIYNECFCLGCHVNVKDNQGTCFADDLRSSFANNVNDNVINLRGSFADNVIYQFAEKHGETWQAKPHQKGKPNNISVNINEDLQSWPNDDNIIEEATLRENFRCIISGPSECGKTFL